MHVESSDDNPLAGIMRDLKPLIVRGDYEGIIDRLLAERQQLEETNNPGVIAVSQVLASYLHLAHRTDAALAAYEYAEARDSSPSLALRTATYLAEIGRTDEAQKKLMRARAAIGQLEYDCFAAAGIIRLAEGNTAAAEEALRDLLRHARAIDLPPILWDTRLVEMLIEKNTCNSTCSDYLNTLEAAAREQGLEYTAQRTRNIIAKLPPK
jgi:tetratricopeptide (TPR) repeat protein